jgi:hypothetical protein
MDDADTDDEYGFKAFFDTMAKRPLHRVITPELIAEQPDDELEVTIFDIAWAVKSPERLQVLADLPDGYSVVYPTMAIEAEVSNGGFNQFFYNPTKQLYDLAVDGYRKLQLPDIVLLLERANIMYGTEARSWQKAIHLLSGTLASFFKSYEHSSLGSLDEQMWAAKETISKKRILFIRNNPQLFTGDFATLYVKPSES